MTYDRFEKHKNFTNNLLVFIITGVNMITARRKKQNESFSSLLKKKLQFEHNNFTGNFLVLITDVKQYFGELNFNKSFFSLLLQFKHKNFTNNLLVLITDINIITAGVKDKTPLITGQKLCFNELDFNKSQNWKETTDWGKPWALKRPKMAK